MFEFINVPIDDFYDTTNGDIIKTKSIHFIVQSEIDRQININLRDVDQIALEEMADYEEVLNLCEQNAAALVEHQLDITKINFMNIPT